MSNNMELYRGGIIKMWIKARRTFCVPMKLRAILPAILVVSHGGKVDRKVLDKVQS